MDLSIWRKSLLNFYGLRYGRTRTRESIVLTIKKVQSLFSLRTNPFQYEISRYFSFVAHESRYREND